MPDYPSRKEEKALLSAGYHRIAGVDEAGRGALAGPVVAATVILPEGARFRWLSQVKDSKLLQGNVREDLYHKMHRSGAEIGIAVIQASIIDEINILNATKKAMHMALERLPEPPDYILTDYVNLPGLCIPQKNIVKGDRLCMTIACASIIAKVVRDRIMIDLHEKYPNYGFDNHKGYGTPEHLERLVLYGACSIHRFTFGPVKDLGRLI
ncbi:MAG: ribonuclease HII [Dehalococcoidia bacterium]|nr:MAG: ribonuclease HII [Dehalococcoidia bacterium]